MNATNGLTLFEQKYTHEQHEQFIENLQQFGNEAYAAHAALLPLSYVRALRNTDDFFDSRCDEALELHAGLLYASAVKRATASDGSDVLLGRLLEAKVRGFSKEERALEVKKINQPRQLRLRSFAEDENGNVTEVFAADDGDAKADTGAQSPVRAASNAAGAPQSAETGVQEDSLTAAPTARGAATRTDPRDQPAPWTGI